MHHIMKILFLTAHLPFPPASGGRRREFELVSRLGKKFQVHLCSLTTTPEIDRKHARQLSKYCKSVNLFNTTQPFPAEHDFRYTLLMKRYFSEEATYSISCMLRHHYFDLVHVEAYYLMQLLPNESNVPILLVEHNMEYMLNLQRLLLSSSLADRFLYWRDYYNTFYWERNFWKKATKIVTVSAEDEISIRLQEPNMDVITIPNGIDHKIVIDRPVDPEFLRRSSFSNSDHIRTFNDNNPLILFVGNFLYDPNIDAALYFCKQIFPLILKYIHNAKLLLVGNSPTPEILKLGTSSNNNIIVTGYVDSLYPFYKAAKVVVCPLRIGGGIKVKILEALRAGKAIVSTSVGAQGLSVDNRALCICDKIYDFAANVVRFLSNPQDRHRQEQEALLFAKTIPTWEKVTEKYIQCYNEMTCTRSAVPR
ncbi:MAG: glycosyltransferase family 4 protein [Nitrososphaeraceae archaeon]